MAPRDTSTPPDEKTHGDRHGSVPTDPGPADLGKRSWWEVVKRAGKESMDDEITDRAAAMTYYAVLALFPAAIVVVSLIGVVGDPERTARTVLDAVGDLAPSSAVDAVRGPVEDLAASSGRAATLLSVGLLGAIWSASGYVAALTRAMNGIYEVDEGRPFWKLRPLQILVTVVGLLVAAVVALSLVITGPVAQAVGNAVGLGDVVLTVWNIAKWPLIVVVVILGLALLYWATPNVEHPRWKWLTPGSLVAVVLWVLVSVAFGFYVGNFGSYDKTYGSLGAVIVFLVWLWLTNLAILFGAEFDAEMERVRELRAGLPAEEDIQLAHRDEPKPSR